jgi:NADPH-dependent ferric siderophore reductase
MSAGQEETAVTESTGQEELSRTQPIRPGDAVVEELRVLRTERPSPGFVRVVLTGADAGFGERFTPRGHDQWFRLFLPTAAGELALPRGGAEGWYSRWLAIAEDSRPVVRNYTLRATRLTAEGWELDVDFVVHQGADGSVDGVAAGWALAARPGDRAGFLDQGVIFRPATSGRIVILADETGLPGVEGIARSLAPTASAAVLLEVPHGEDMRDLPTAAEADIRWIVREGPAGRGSSALDPHLDDALFAGADYVYAVGEASFALRVRQRAEAAGVPRDRVDFCAYWRPVRRAA